MKYILLSTFAIYTLLVGGYAYAQTTQYGADFVGPIQQDPFAQTTGTRCGPQENGDYILCEAVGNLISQRQTSFASFLRELYMLAFILAGTVAFIRIVYGGVLYSVSGVINQKKKAIDIFKNVAIGLGLLMGSYVILNTINPALTILSLPKVTKSTGPKALPQNRPFSSLEPQPYSVDKDTIARWEREERETLSTIELLQDRISLIETTTPNRTPEQKAELESLRNQLQASEAKVKSLQDGIKEGVYEP